MENGRSPRETLGLRPKDQSCHHEVWLHLDLVGNQSSGSCPHPPNKEKGRYRVCGQHWAPCVTPNPEWAPFGALFSVGMGPFGRSWGSKCREPSAGRTPCMTMKATAHFIFVVCTRIYASSSSACDASRTSFRDRMRPRQVRCVSSFS